MLFCRARNMVSFNLLLHHPYKMNSTCGPYKPIQLKTSDLYCTLTSRKKKGCGRKVVKNISYPTLMQFIYSTILIGRKWLWTHNKFFIWHHSARWANSSEQDCSIYLHEIYFKIEEKEKWEGHRIKIYGLFYPGMR